MGRRLRAISQSVIKAICSDATHKRSRLAFIFAFFRLLQIVLSRFHWELYRSLRSEVWEIDEREYKASFKSIDPRDGLLPIGDLGYSGSVSPLSADRCRSRTNPDGLTDLLHDP